MTETKMFDFDQMLETLGGFGNFQKKRLLLFTISLLFKTITSYSYIFTAIDPKYRCLIPQCDNTTHLEYITTWLPDTVPFHDKNRPEKCQKFGFVTNQNSSQLVDHCPIDYFQERIVLDCDQFVFEDTGFKSMVHEFGLFCSENIWKLSLIVTLRHLGFVIMGSFTGFLGDRYGRRKLFIIAVLLSSMFGLVKSFSPNYWVFIALEFAGAMTDSAIFSSYFNLAMEMFVPKYRIKGTFLLLCLCPLGGIMLGIIAWNVHEWQSILRIGCIPSFLMVLYFWYLPESIRWLIVKGRYDEANALIEQIARENGVELEKNTPLACKENCEKIVAKNESLPIRQIFKTPKLGITLVICMSCALLFSFIGSGLFLTSVSIAGNIYFNFIGISFIELPANVFIIFSCNKIGRKATISTCAFLNAALFVAYIFLPPTSWFQLPIYLASKCMTITTISTLQIYITELFPTPYRQTISGICLAAGRIGSVLISPVALMILYWKFLPVTLFSGAALIGGILSLQLSDTSDKKLPDSFEEIENYQKSVNP